MTRHTIPDYLFSQATIEYVGFNRTKAAQLWQRWDNWPTHGFQREIDDSDDLLITFLDILTRFINETNDAWDDDDGAWHSCMEHWGIATEMQGAIMDPRFKRLRLTRSCVQWILDTVELRYRGLEHFLCTSPGREALQSGTFHPQSLAADIYRQSQHDSSETHTEFSDETFASSVNFTAPGMTVLYKAVSSTQVNDRLRGSLLDSQGKLEKVQFIATRPSSDFSSGRMMTYFSTSFDTAQMYASYLKRCDSVCQEFAVVRICIPDSALESLDSTQIVHVYFPSEDWKKLVWYCRRSRIHSDIGRFEKATVIVGHVACKSDKTFCELGSWEDVTEEHVLGLEGHGGQPEVQYAFSLDDDGRDFLETYATDIKVLRYSNREYLQWMEEHKDGQS